VRPKHLEVWIPPKPEWPYYTAIRTAFIQRFGRWYAWAPGTPGRVQLEGEWTMLASQLFPNPSTIPNLDWRSFPTRPRIIRVLRNVLRVKADHKGRGRPIGYKRRQASLALDLRNSDPKLRTWRALTDYLCNCGQREHAPNSSCQNDLRRETVWLKNALKTMGITVLPAK
jgi:hypothetical protein